MLEFRLQTNVTYFEGIATHFADLFTAAMLQKIDTLDTLMQQDLQRQLEGPVLNHVTGKLVRSVEAIPATQNDTVIEGSVQAGGGLAPYAIIQEEGVDHPWDIVAVNAEALRFMMGGRVVFAKKVTHPPLPAKHFMRNTWERWKPTIIEEINAVPAEVVRNL